ncbi:uncharacterized protein PHACADRAFT_210132 [Phanerochaete carnosa HHB-10118-sp]|uniref:Uncharacterized protein n=1 Tax=Phanerochaete carnosa (strain HHB-10118-sp) TaxID=650164 RepID=K5WV83_PHACS|nr:uncharacterized protein PHACADRAFT_210132 [Phanerochaete carnosa HHB-10118-sp]EKM54322.1 hypothetical protein PHACADRAFT_210132 [Phanerochaete carnosa HHB-10118-sp]
MTTKIKPVVEPPSSTIRFPAPIGGVPLAHDFAPSVLFACLYGLLAFLGFYRIVRSASRSLLVFSLLAFIVERVVIWSLRAEQARTPSEDFSRSLTIYWQITFSAGFLMPHSITLNLMRCVVVGTTKGISSTLRSSSTIKTEEVGGLSSFVNTSKTSVAVPRLGHGAQEDQPQKRAMYRRIFGLIALQTIVPFVISVVMGNGYVDAETDATKVSAIQTLRYVIAALALALIQIGLALSIWAILTVPRIARKVILLFALETTLTVIPIYHLVIMTNSTTSLTSTTSGSQNTPGEKAAFYVFQVLPEFAPCVVLLIVNMKTMFGTGNFGDRIMDPKKKPTDQEAA